MTNLFNKNLRQATTVEGRKDIAAPETAKPSDQESFYWPISPLAPDAKILESLVLYIRATAPLKDYQHGMEKASNVRLPCKR